MKTAQLLIAFGLAKTTAQRLVGLPHVSPDMAARWLAYCHLRGPGSPHNTNAFLIIRLRRNDIPAPSWGALRRLKELHREPECLELSAEASARIKAMMVKQRQQYTNRQALPITHKGERQP